MLSCRTCGYQAIAKIVVGQENKLYLGNLDAKRDWGYAKDYVRAWRSLNKAKAKNKCRLEPAVDFPGLVKLMVDSDLLALNLADHK